MANGQGGRRAGAGRKKGSPDKVTLQKRALLESAGEQFKAADYDPLKEMRLLAQKKRLAKQDPLKFQMHRDLARKYYPDVMAMKLSGDQDNPIRVAGDLSPAERKDRLAELIAQTNGHEVEAR